MTCDLLIFTFRAIHKRSQTFTNINECSRSIEDIQTFTDIYELSRTFKNVNENSWMFTNIYKCSQTFLFILEH